MLIGCQLEENPIKNEGQSGRPGGQVGPGCLPDGLARRAPSATSGAIAARRNRGTPGPGGPTKAQHARQVVVVLVLVVRHQRLQAERKKVREKEKIRKKRDR